MERRKESREDDRRQSQKPYPGPDRRGASGYPQAGHENAEDPKTEQDHQDLHHQGGPDPRIPK